MGPVNWLAVIAAAIVAAGIALLWYGPLFGRAKLEERLARWLLMAHDRMQSNAVPLTHEFLAVMLGVRHAGVTVAIHSFEKRGLIATKRGQLTVVDRVGIEKVAGSFYGVPEAELRRLLSDG